MREKMCQKLRRASSWIKTSKEATQWSTLIPDKLRVAKRAQKFNAFNGTRMYITLFTTARQ